MIRPVCADWMGRDSGVSFRNPLTDVSRSMEVVGTGALLSRASWAAQMLPNLIGFGSGPLDGCPACAQNTAARNYGLGVVILGPWITQTKLFAGNAFTVGYLPSRRLTVTVGASSSQDAFDQKGNYSGASTPIFKLIGNALAPNRLVTQ